VPHETGATTPTASTCTSPAPAARGSTRCCCGQGPSGGGAEDLPAAAAEGRKSKAGADPRCHVPRLLRLRRRVDHQAELRGPGLHRRGARLPGQGGRSEDAGGVRGNTLHGHIVRGLDDKPEKLLFRQIYLDCASSPAWSWRCPGWTPSASARPADRRRGLTLACAALEPGSPAPRRPTLPLRLPPRLGDGPGQGRLRRAAQFFRLFDPLHEREEEIFTRLGYIDCQHLAPGSGPRPDARGPDGHGLPALHPVRGLQQDRSKKEMVIFPDFGHEACSAATTSSSSSCRL